jgi:hypothetical protein
VVRLIGNRASFLCTKAPMRRIQKIVSGHQLTSTSVPLTGKGPSHCWPGQVKAERSEKLFGPVRSAFAGRAEHQLVALPTSGDLLICAKDLFVEANAPRAGSYAIISACDGRLPCQR